MSATNYTFDWWQSALENPSKIGTEILRFDTPQLGYYKRRKPKPSVGWTPVAIIEEDGKLIAVAGSWENGARVDADTMWNWCGENPISYEVWYSVAVDGNEFPDSIAQMLTPSPNKIEPTDDERHAYWRQALDGVAVPVIPESMKGERHCGYFRVESISSSSGVKFWQAVHVWFDTSSGGYRATIDGKTYEADSTSETMLSLALKGPVTKEAYEAFLKTKSWPDDTPVIGHNSGGAIDDLFEKLTQKLDDLVKRAGDDVASFGGKPTVETWNDDWLVRADRVANWKNAFSEMVTELKRAFEAEKRPWLDGGKAVDNKWRDCRERADNAVKRMNTIGGDLLKVKRDYTAEKERIEREAARINSPELDPAPEEPVQEVKAKAGTTGRAMSLQKRKVAVITDNVAFATYLLTGFKEPLIDVVEVLQKIGQRLVSNGTTELTEIPGLSFKIEEKAR